MYYTKSIDKENSMCTYKIDAQKGWVFKINKQDRKYYFCGLVSQFKLPKNTSVKYYLTTSIGE